MTAAEKYAARIDAVNAQRRRVRGEEPAADRWAGRTARRFRMDPHRELHANLQIIASYVQPDDVVVDVGGGAGRVCLPLALRCREVINVDPSPAMGAEFEDCAAEAGITNARYVRADWLAAEGVAGDVVLAANVTYFVRDIVPFVEKMAAAARRRVMITVWSIPPPDQNAKLFRLIYGEEQEPVPSYRELLPVLWELGILPDVRVLPEPFLAGAQLPQTREEAVSRALEVIGVDDEPRARAPIGAHFDELFAPSPEGFRPLWLPDVRELVITWEAHRGR